jgi:STAS domain-containing protein
MLLIEEGKNTIHASFQGVKRFTCLFSKDVENELISFIEDKSRELILDLEGINFIDSVAFDTIINSKSEIYLQMLKNYLSC